MSHEPTGKEIAEANFLKNRIFGDDLELDKSDPDGDSNADIKAFFHNAEVANKVGKSSGAAVAFDFAVPPVDDTDSEENSPFWKAPKVIRYQPSKTSGTKKFDELVALVQKVFAGHPEEMAETIQICEQARSDARAEAIARM